MSPAKISIIPRPSLIEELAGHFEIREGFFLVVDMNNSEIRNTAEFFAGKLRKAPALEVPVRDTQEAVLTADVLELRINKEDKDLGREGYSLEIGKESIILEAPEAPGLFYGIQTLLQLLPPEIAAEKMLEPNTPLLLPCLRIKDTPRFPYRGMHLDVGRHFFPKSFIKKYIDILSLHKFNTFHWHLTEDQGWRIEIKKYPKLTQIASTRRETLVGHARSLPRTFDGQPYGGYYTQEDIKEIVAYASRRYVTIIPEIEMPGHSQAALAAYPELSCTGGPFEVSTQWGIHREVYCAGNDQVFAFLEDVLAEVIDLFPGTYIHIGGDECPKDRWKACEKCQARIKAEGLTDENELQSYFIKRIEKFLLSKGRSLIGWDEILEGGLAPEATVMSWRGMEGGFEAAKQGHDVIMTPVSHCYFDYYQGDPESEPLAIGGYTTLKKVYAFEPIPEELAPEEARHILGTQGNVWTEYIRTPDYAEYMSLPRMSALAEVVWSPRNARDWKDFRQRLGRHFERLEAMDVSYSPGSFAVEILSVFDPRTARTSIVLDSEQISPEIHFTLDGTDPTPDSSEYEGPIPLNRTLTVRAGIFEGAELKEKASEQTFSFHKGINAGLTLLTSYKGRYAAGGKRALLDGMTGSEDYRDGCWQGYETEDLVAVVDLGEITELGELSICFLQNIRAWIFLPTQVSIAVSDDGVEFWTVATFAHNIPQDRPGTILKEFSHQFKEQRARHIRIRAKNVGMCPEGHPNAGEKAWLFADEILLFIFCGTRRGRRGGRWR